MVVSAGGVLSGVDGGGVEGVMTLVSGALATGVTMQSGAIDVVQSGAHEADVVLVSGATLRLIDPRIADVVRVGPASATVTVSGASVQSGAEVTTVSATVISGGREIVESGGTATLTTILSGGTEILLPGATANRAFVSAGGVLSGVGALRGAVKDSGRVSGMTVVSDARLFVTVGGEEIDTRVARGGVLLDNGTAVYSGTAAYSLAGTLSGHGLLVQDGPGVLILNGVASGFTGSAVISGGTLELATGTLGTAPVEFAGYSAVLQIQKKVQPRAAQTFGEAVEDFGISGEAIDLAQQAFVSGATARLSGGVLILRDGGYAARFDLTGSTAASYVVTSDGHGGTLITASSGSTALAQAAAAFTAAKALGDIGACESPRGAPGLIAATRENHPVLAHG